MYGVYPVCTLCVPCVYPVWYAPSDALPNHSVYTPLRALRALRALRPLRAPGRAAIRCRCTLPRPRELDDVGFLGKGK